MRRMLLVVALFGAVSLAGSVLAQGPGGPGGFGKKKGPPAVTAADDVKDLEAMVQRLRRQLAEVEARLQQAKGGEEPEADKPAGPPSGFSKKKGFGPPGFGRGFGPGGEGKGFGPGGKGFGPRGKGKRFGAGDADKKPTDQPEEKRAAPPAAPATPSIEERLDRLMRDLAEIRRELKQK